jgi:hypothetical protein
MKKKENKIVSKIDRGEIFQLKKPPLIALVISNRLHNLFSNYLTIILATDKNVDRVRESLEVPFELENGKKIKLLPSCFHTVSKQQFYDQGTFLGKIDEKTAEKLSQKIKSILDLNE